MEPMLKKLLIVVFPLLFFVHNVSATHIMGSDITYKCDSTNKFEITFTLYRDCRGIPFTIGDGPERYVKVVCGSTEVTIPMTLQSITDISPTCATDPAPCNPPNTMRSGIQYGVERHIYKGMVNFNVAPFNVFNNNTCCEVLITYMCGTPGGVGCRNSAITTGQADQTFYTYARLNRCASPCNNSPDFTNPPVAIICCNQDYVFNNGALDTNDNGDSLSYALVPALQGPGQNVTYSGTFSFQRPCTFAGFPNNNANLPFGFHLDDETGDLAFRPTRCNEVFTVVIQVNEWRKINGTPTKIGETRRDMQIVVVSCPNNRIPTLPFIQQTKACANQQVCINMNSNDLDRDDTVKLSWNGGIQGATFTHTNGVDRLSKGQMCWTPTDNDVSSIPYTFTVTAKDDNCPLAGQSIRSYSVVVYPQPKADRDYDTLTCGRMRVKATPLQNYGSGVTHSWTFKDSLGNTVRVSNRIEDTVKLQPGLHQVTYQIGSNIPCFNAYIDTIYVPPYVTVKLPADTLICEGSSYNVLSTTSGGTSPFRYLWNTSSNDTLTSKFITPTTDTTLKIFVEDANGCTNEDSIRLRYRLNPVIDVGVDQRICRNQTAFVEGIHDTLNYDYLWNTGDTVKSIYIENAGDYWLKLTDSLGCFSSDTMTLFVNQVNVNAGNDREICTNQPVTLNGNGADNYNWFDAANPSTSVSNSQSYTFTSTTDKTFILRGVRTEGGVTCENFDTIFLNVNPLPQISLQQREICEDLDNYSLDLMLANGTPSGGVWSSSINPSFVFNNNLFKTSIAGFNTSPGHRVVYTYTDDKGCINRDSIHLRVNPKPRLNIRDTAICADEGSLRLNSLFMPPTPPTFNGVPTWESTPNPQRSAISGSAAAGFNLNLNQLMPDQTYVFYYGFTDFFGCTNTDTFTVKPKIVPTVDAGFMNQICVDAPPLNIDSAANPTPDNGTWSTIGTSNLISGYFYPANVPNPNNQSYWFRYTYVLDGCDNSDSVSIFVRPLPTVTANASSIEICENVNSVNLIGTPVGSTGVWSGQSVTGTNFNPDDAGPGTFTARYEYTNPSTGCRNWDTVNIMVQQMPEISLSSATEACEGIPFPLQSTVSNAQGIIWTTSGDGRFDNEQTGGNSSNNVNSIYYPGANDRASGLFTITGTTTGNRNCPAAIRNMDIVIYPTPSSAIVADPDRGCEPLPVNFTAITSLPSDSVSFIWNMGDGNTENRENFIYTYNNHGNYNVQLTVNSNHNCSTSATQAIEVYPTPNAAMDASRWKTTIVAPTINFFDRSTVENPGRINFWEWTFGDPNNSSSNSQNTSFTYPTDTGNYLVSLLVRTVDGCEDTTNRWLKVDPDITVFIPNAFTPNQFGPDINKRFYVTADGFESIEIFVFNRWGEELYYSTNIKEGWDGKYKGEVCQQDVYVYLVKVVSLAKKEFVYSGTVTLLR